MCRINCGAQSCRTPTDNRQALWNIHWVTGKLLDFVGFIFLIIVFFVFFFFLLTLIDFFQQFIHRRQVQVRFQWYVFSAGSSSPFWLRRGSATVLLTTTILTPLDCFWSTTIFFLQCFKYTVVTWPTASTFR